MSERAAFQDFGEDLPSEAEQLSAIAQSIRFAKDFAVIVAVCNDAGLRDRLIQRLAALLPGVSGRTARVANGDDSLIPYLQEAGSAAYLNVIGMGDIVPAGTEGDEHPLVASLNANRNALPSLFGGVVILWLPAFLTAAIHRGAPDFFSIRSGLYRFAVSKDELRNHAEELVGLPVAEARKLEPEAREERISRLIGLIGEVGEPSNAKDQAMLGRLYDQLAGTYATGPLDQDKSKLALQAWDRAAGLYRETRSTVKEANVLLNVGKLHYQEGRNSPAAEIWNHAATLFREAGSHLGEARVLFEQGDLEFRDGRIDEALKAWNSAETLFQRARDPHGQAKVLKRRGDILAGDGRNEEAINAWNEAETIFKKVGDPLGHANVLLSLGNHYFKEGKTGQASAAWWQAEALYRQAQHPLGQANVLRRRGRMALTRAEPLEARQLFQRAQELYAFQNMAFFVAETHALIWRTYPPESPAARHHRAEAERIWRELGREDLIPKYFPTD